MRKPKVKTATVGNVTTTVLVDDVVYELIWVASMCQLPGDLPRAEVAQVVTAAADEIRRLRKVAGEEPLTLSEWSAANWPAAREGKERT